MKNPNPLLLGACLGVQITLAVVCLFEGRTGTGLFILALFAACLVMDLKLLNSKISERIAWDEGFDAGAHWEWVAHKRPVNPYLHKALKPSEKRQ